MDKRHNLFGHAALLVGALFLLLNTPLVQTAQAQDKEGKVSHDLTLLYEGQAGKRAAPAQIQGLDLEPIPLPIPIRGDKVLIDAVAAGDLADLEAELGKLGMEGTAAYGRICSGWLPISAIDDLEGLSSLQHARPSYRATNGGLTTTGNAAGILRYDDDDDDDGGSSDPRGSVVSGGDPAMRSDLARDEFDVDGSGVIVGHLSDSYDQGGLGGSAAADVASGDLPPGVIVLDDTGFCFPGVPCSDEGRAMMQLTHDVAPGAGLSFHTAFNGQADFALGIEELAGCPPGSAPGCVPPPDSADIIVDDIIYFAEPMFQDGIIAQAVDVVKGAGNSYFSSAGNNDRQAYDSGFNSGPFLSFGAIPDCGIGTFPPPLFPGFAHDFDSGAGVDIFQEFTLNPGEGVGSPIVFQWDQPYFSVSGFPGSLSDYDIYLILTDPGATGLPVPCVLQGSAFGNLIGDPLEVMSGIGLSSAATVPVKVAILIVEFASFTGPASLMKYVSFGGNSPDEFDTKSGTTYGHSNAAGGEAVGAARYTETPVFGVAPPLIESFSSAGGTPILFATDGTPLGTPDVRLKPGVTGPDGGNTTFFFPGSLDLESDGVPNFFGTSASAPHVSGVAALLLEACANDDDCSGGGDDDDDGYLAKNSGTSDDDDGGGGDAGDSLTPDQIYDLLRSTAIDMDDPATSGFDTGFDFGTGFGFVDACDALAALEDDDDDDYCEADDDDDDGAYYRHVADAADGEQTNETTLLDNYPDPFNPETTIAFELADSRAVQLNIYDVVGRRIATLVNGVLPSGRHEVRWEASNLPSGMYFYQLVTDDFVQVRPMMLVK